MNLIETLTLLMVITVIFNFFSVILFGFIMDSRNRRQNQTNLHLQERIKELEYKVDYFEKQTKIPVPPKFPKPRVQKYG